MSRTLRVLLVHNFYQNKGAEDGVFFAEKALLEAHGHTVFTYTVDNLINTFGEKAKAPIEALWSAAAYRHIQELIREKKIDIAHFHNTFFRISPAAYYACRALGVPVVQTLHNYRVLCPAATFYRDGHVCENCLRKKVPLAALRYRCYRSSFAESLGMTAMLSFHNIIQTWRTQVDVFIALSNFSKSKFVEAGIPESHIAVKSNFLPTPANSTSRRGDYALFLGRLSPEKGLATLFESWAQLTDIPLKVAGDGPLRSFVETRANALPHVDYLGLLSNGDVMQQLASARFLVLPSEWYEGFPLTLLEAFSLGVPVLASDLGSPAEIVRDDGKIGLLFKSGDAADLARQAKWMWTHPAELAQMSENVRREYEEKYTPEKNYAQLLSIYERVLLKK